MISTTVFLLTGALVAGVWWFHPRSWLVPMAILLFAAAPIGMAVLASWLGERYGCSVSEAGASPCWFGGYDLGPILADLFTGGWYMMATLPVGLVLGIVWLATRRGPRRRDP